MKNLKKKETPNKFKESFDTLSIGRKILLFIFLCIMAIITLPAFLILLIGLLPTITILITDPKNTNKLIIVGAFNLAGIFMYLINILNEFTLSHTLAVISNIFSLVIMFGSAAIGFIIYIEIPNLFVFLHKISAKKRLSGIENKLTKLTEEWGQETIDRQVNQIAK